MASEEMRRMGGYVPPSTSEAMTVGGTVPSSVPAMPDVVRQYLQIHPEVLNVLMHPDALASLVRAAGNADWCAACGASHGVMPRDILPDPALLTDAQIDALAARLSARAAARSGGGR
jgi:hypothetical protein